MFVLRGCPVRLTRPRKIAGDVRGDVSKPKDGRPYYLMRVQKGLPEAEELEVIIHECLHVCYWDMDEEAIEESARDIAAVLVEMGWSKD